MSTVLIDSQPYQVYADVDEADLYLQASLHAYATWATTTDTVKAIALVTATRLLDRQKWLGDKYDADQVLSWPRANTGVDGVVDTVTPEDIVNATIELAFALVDGSEVQSEQNTAQKIASLRAGSVAISYFRGAEGSSLRFPLIIHELVRAYLAGSGSSVTNLASGTDGVATSLDFGVTGPI